MNNYLRRAFLEGEIMDWSALKISPENFLHLDNLDSYSIEEAINILAIVIDGDLINSEIIYIDKCIFLFEKFNFDSMLSYQKSILYYNIANAWDYKYKFSKTNSERKQAWDFEQPFIEKQIFYLRSSIREPDFCKLSIYQQCMTYTNLANTLDTVGRFIEAIAYWNKAISLDGNFGMALGNIGMGLESYARNLYDGGQQCVFMKLALDYYEKAISTIDKAHELYVKSFKLRYKKLNVKLHKYCNIKNTIRVMNKVYALGDTEGEKNYRLWCLQNILFLNPINDLGALTLGSSDITTTPDMKISFDVGPRYQGFFNQMKQEFVSARFLYYEGIKQKRLHFSDKRVILYDTVDYPCYSLSIEKTKSAFRVAYGILDQIAYFINEYFCLGVKQNSVYFKTIWFEKGKKDNGLLPQLQNRNNLPLRGLYWLSKDLFEDKQGFKDLVEPDAQNLYEIRNHIEHKYLKVHDLITWDRNKTDSSLIDDLAYSIERNDFERKTLFLLRLVRNALIYLSLSIHIEEVHNDKTDKNGLVIPEIMDIVNDRYKI